MNKKQLGREMYMQYAKRMGLQHTMPAWEELSKLERKAWIGVARYVIMDIVL
ncbi:hypothetical protein CLV24_11428 [Pontibacter ummariensis]|uniref:Uncharacterized protein n=1 Tax=Pontibacter ummariensis TaxID=1610492 RepID=A0A239HN84_9BACT|nr:hypothetical protein [Pontibacter ummariensis]PRY10300.1 hypothetical protein CLV24_11428 [Pontibacter ummariensis]SNS81714.1 hypothetical protein SAMN06296052_11428 [Pontibacter ummariensis]